DFPRPWLALAFASAAGADAGAFACVEPGSKAPAGAPEARSPLSELVDGTPLVGARVRRVPWPPGWCPGSRLPLSIARRTVPAVASVSMVTPAFIFSVKDASADLPTAAAGATAAAPACTAPPWLSSRPSTLLAAAAGNGGAGVGISARRSPIIVL